MDNLLRSEAINELADALSKAQAVMESAAKDATNPHYKSSYATLAAVIDTIRKPLADNGLSVTQLPQIDAARGRMLVTLLMHKSGQYIGSEYPLPDSATPQQMGSALTYARRYSLAALVCNAAEEDDDANEAEKAAKAARKPPAARPDVMGQNPDAGRDNRGGPEGAAGNTTAPGADRSKTGASAKPTAKLTITQIAALEAEAREAADFGTQAMKILWARSSTPQQRAVMQGLMTELKERCAKADKRIAAEQYGADPGTGEIA